MLFQDPHQPDSKSIPDSDNQTLYTPPASTVDVPANPVSGPDVRQQVPLHGRTYIIRAISKEDDNVLTLLNGNVVLAPMNTRGSIYWECVESQGWFGFRNRGSNKFLGHGWGILKCEAQQLDGHEHFTITPMPLGGYIMQMLDWWTLRPVVLNPEHGLQKLGRTGNRLSEGLLWQFISVEPRLGDA